MLYRIITMMCMFAYCNISILHTEIVYQEEEAIICTDFLFSFHCNWCRLYCNTFLVYISLHTHYQKSYLIDQTEPARHINYCFFLLIQKTEVCLQCTHPPQTEEDHTGTLLYIGILSHSGTLLYIGLVSHSGMQVHSGIVSRYCTLP